MINPSLGGTLIRHSGGATLTVEEIEHANQLDAAARAASIKLYARVRTGEPVRDSEALRKLIRRMECRVDWRSDGTDPRAIALLGFHDLKKWFTRVHEKQSLEWQCVAASGYWSASFHVCARAAVVYLHLFALVTRVLPFPRFMQLRLEHLADVINYVRS